MARMLGAQWVGPHHDNGRMSRYDVVCLHTIVGNPPAHAAHFSTRGDGLIYQSRDTAFASAANYEGNSRVISIENDDMGTEFGSWNVNDGHAVPGFTAQQVEAIARICAWAYRTHGIPLVRCPDSRSTSRGIGYHRQGIDGNWSGYRFGGRVSGGQVWTKSRGKVCPGDRRIAQLPQIIARARVLAGLDQPPRPTPTPIPDDVPEDEMKTWYVQGDTMPHVFCVSADGDHVARRHVSRAEWGLAQATGEKVYKRPQAEVDALPWGETEGTDPWTRS